MSAGSPFAASKQLRSWFLREQRFAATSVPLSSSGQAKDCKTVGVSSCPGLRSTLWSW